ncbi:MAG: type II toxin-antitoxin system PemK/MazF family toxin [Chloroflexi bacterium]|nr:type II toxin-antitoxin system PemK/MazF family toxin [Chloroflexota bacterium]
MDAAARRGEVWQIDFDPVRGHEQGRERPAVVVSADAFNAGPAALVVVCPLTTRQRGIRFHVPVEPLEGGLRARSFVLCDQIRTVSTERLISRLGSLSTTSVDAIEERLRILLDL